MSNIEMIKDLRTLTQAGMKDCKDALVESNWDLDKAVDVIKAKGKLVSAGNKVASEGVVGIMSFTNLIVMVEVNCVTDFVARMPEFDNFVNLCLNSIGDAIQKNSPWDSQEVEAARKELISITKENIIIRRWWGEQIFKPETHLFSYVHTNGKIGAILNILGTEGMQKNPEFMELCENITLQIVAMNPVAISPDKLDPSILDRQKAIFQTQLDEMNKPAAAHEKIMSGKLNKWYSESCLLNQESVVTPKVTVGQLIDNLSSKLGSSIQVINFIRCQVGENVDKSDDNFVDEVAQLVNEA